LFFELGGLGDVRKYGEKALKFLLEVIPFFGFGPKFKGLKSELGVFFVEFVEVVDEFLMVFLKM
jgi:hypothetical protein